MTARKRVSVVSFFKRIGQREVFAYLAVFISFFLTAKLGQYIFYIGNTSPAIFWPPFGIALGAILVGGYRMWFPIALAELCAIFSAGMSPLPVELAAIIGQTIQPLIGAYVMNKMGFDGSLARARDAFLLVGAALFATMIAPSASTLAQVLSQSLTADPTIAWSRSWAGGILSVLTITPLITTWLPWRPLILSRPMRFQLALAFASLLTVTFFLFWTPYPANFGLTSIYVWLGILVWIALSFEPRIVALSLLFTSVFGMAGALIVHPGTLPVNQQLFSDELVIEFIGIIFILFSSILEERRSTRRKLEESVNELSAALKYISREDQAKGEFIATLAHELRNPLSPILSTLELLKLQGPKKEQSEIIESAEHQLRFMRRLLDDLLDVARVSRNTFKLQKEPVEITPLLRRSMESVIRLYTSRSHTLSSQMPQQEGLVVDADPVRLQQIVVNLLNNAGKYTPQGGKIDLSCTVEGRKLMIRISDNGIGIPAESMQEIFEPFRQIRPTPEFGTGLGIGLSLTKRLVEMHGGTIEVASDGVGRGASFTVYLPLLEKAPTLKKPMTETATQPIETNKGTVLVVDDNEPAAQGLTKLLELKGYQAQYTLLGMDALKSAQEFSPDYILLDIGLPDIDGYHVARLLREHGIKAKIIALSGYGQDEDKQKAKEAGFDAHLTKPVGIADVEALLVK